MLVCIQTFMKEILKLHLNLQKPKCSWRGMQCLERTNSFKKNTSENAYKPSNLITGDNFTQMVRFYFDFSLKGDIFCPHHI